MTKFFIILAVTSIFLLMDWYIWNATKNLLSNQTFKQYYNYGFWIVTFITLIGMWLYNFTTPEWLGKNNRTIIMTGVFINYASKFFVVIFIFIDDLVRLIKYIYSKFATPANSPENNSNDTITRSDFLVKTAVVAGTIPALAMTWGIISGAHDYRIRKVKLAIKNLPKAFRGMTIAQISDIHSGSFFNKVAVKGGVEMLMNKKPDLVFFTGDLVNNKASEVEEYIPIFNKIKAPLGVYSTLGNHDYGDYVQWNSPAAKKQNLNDLKKSHQLLGWNLLNDENKIIQLGGENLAIIGVQNIGIGKRFPWYGNLEKAHLGTQDAAVKLLLSHDPTHWDGEVNTKYKDIDVTFSGHTHGTQMGVNIGDYTWSPAQYVYKQWAGLYKEGEQQLYVNRGYGYLGYPGRIGMPPEITIFELTEA